MGRVGGAASGTPKPHQTLPDIANYLAKISRGGCVAWPGPGGWGPLGPGSQAAVNPSRTAGWTPIPGDGAGMLDSDGLTEDGGRVVRLFSYVVVSDSGFAPNPFWGYCTLAACKPAIRRAAAIGDWVAGLSPKAFGNRLVYAMEVTDKIPIDAYFADARFWAKQPDFTRPELVWRQGDNFYEPGPTPGQFRQLRSRHSLRNEVRTCTRRDEISAVMTC